MALAQKPANHKLTFHIAQGYIYNLDDHPNHTITSLSLKGNSQKSKIGINVHYGKSLEKYPDILISIVPHGEVAGKYVGIKFGINILMLDSYDSVGMIPVPMAGLKIGKLNIFYFSAEFLYDFFIAPIVLEFHYLPDNTISELSFGVTGGGIITETENTIGFTSKIEWMISSNYFCFVEGNYHRSGPGLGIRGGFGLIK